MNEQKKQLYLVFAGAIVLHILFFASMYVVYALGIIAATVLIGALYKASTGRLLGMSTALLVSLIGHSALFVASHFLGIGIEEEVEKVIRFQAPPPILEKNFDLAKRPEISEVQMEMLASLAPPDLPSDISAITDVSAVGSDLLGSVLPGVETLGTFGGAKAEELDFDDVEMVELTETSGPVQEALSLKQELLNVQDLDIGRYQAIIIQDPDNKRAIRGFFNMTVVDYDLADKNRDRFPTAVEELMRYMRDHTQINARIEGTTLRLSDTRILKQPMVYMTGNDAVLQVSDTEKQNLGEYLKNGGFLFSEEIRQSDSDGGLVGLNAGVEGTPFDRQFKALMKDQLVLGSDGSKWQRVPKTHALYHSFWDFDDGPPMGGAPGGNVFDLEMLELRGRVAVVFSDLNISWYWGDPLADARERGLQFGVNLIVFALTQPGGVANVTQFTE
mgnify:CR=1 FL=1